jgi:hypothetical protein
LFDGVLGVKFDLIIQIVQSMPTATFALILFMSMSAALLANHILQIGIYTTIAAVPTLLMAGVFAHAVFVAHNVYISPDKASNTAIAASFGFISLAALSLLIYRMYTLLNDRR